jgi:hypothetical protein
VDLERVIDKLTIKEVERARRREVMKLQGDNIGYLALARVLLLNIGS